MPHQILDRANIPTPLPPAELPITDSQFPILNFSLPPARERSLARSNLTARSAPSTINHQPFGNPQPSTLNPQPPTSFKCLGFGTKRSRGLDVFAFPILKLILVANGC